MQSVTSTWYECAVKYAHTTEEGAQKSVTETYVVEACSFTEAENRIIKEMTPVSSGDLEIKKICPLTLCEVFFSGKDTDDKWFKCKLTFITLDEKSNKEKRSANTYLVQAASLLTALNYMMEEMNNTMIDYVTSNISETKIMNVIRR